MNLTELNNIARGMVAKGKGILAADESTGTIKKRFDQIKVESTEDARRDYREMLFRSAGMAEHISGVILFDETIRQKAKDGTPLIDIIKASGAIPGIKVDKGAKEQALCPGEKVTEGLDGLRDRLAEYHQMGARFAKWRAVITIGDGIPSTACVRANAHALARYAALCQEQGLVPIVEPEVLMDGDHTIERCFEATAFTLNEVYQALFDLRVQLEGTVLKPNMVLSGKDCGTQAGPEQVAEMTLRCLKRGVPAAVPGIAFLSGGQSDEDATANLSAINALAESQGAPWNLTFSYGRALQHPALMAWNGKAENEAKAQTIFNHRARMNGTATLGRWEPSLEQELAA